MVATVTSATAITLGTMAMEIITIQITLTTIHTAMAVVTTEVATETIAKEETILICPMAQMPAVHSTTDQTAQILHQTQAETNLTTKVPKETDPEAGITGQLTPATLATALNVQIIQTTRTIQTAPQLEIIPTGETIRE